MVIQLSLALEKMGHRAALGVFCNDSHPNPEISKRAREAGLMVEEIPCHGRLDRRAIAHTRKFARDFAADVVHSHGYKTNMYIWLALGSRGPKLVSTCHLYTDATLALRIYGALDRFLLRSYHAVSAVSARERDRVVGSGVPASRVRVIDNGIHCDTFAGAKPSLDRDGAHLLVGTVGRLVAQKNPEGFLTAARAAAPRFPNAHFVFVGDGPDRGKLEHLRRDWGLEANVRFAGFRPDMPGVYASLDIFVLPSIDEGLPMAILECMAAGVPVIATRVGAVEKVVRNGETGLLLDPGDQVGLDNAVRSLLEDRELARRLGKAGQQWVYEHFSDEAMARNYLDLYRQAGASENCT